MNKDEAGGNWKQFKGKVKEFKGKGREVSFSPD